MRQTPQRIYFLTMKVTGLVISYNGFGKFEAGLAGILNGKL
jgi:hypothetical protein